MSYAYTWFTIAAALAGTVVVLLFEQSRLRQRIDYTEKFMDWMAKSNVTFTMYQYNAMRTAKPQEARDRLGHAVLGLADEIGELAKTAKAHLYYGKPLDKANVAEELGDILWFVQLACTATGFNLAEVAEANIEKLRVRYPQLYSNEAALARADKGGRA